MDSKEKMSYGERGIQILALMVTWVVVAVLGGLAIAFSPISITFEEGRAGDVMSVVLINLGILWGGVLFVGLPLAMLNIAITGRHMEWEGKEREARIALMDQTEEKFSGERMGTGEAEELRRWLNDKGFSNTDIIHGDMSGYIEEWGNP